MPKLSLRDIARDLAEGKRVVISHPRRSGKSAFYKELTSELDKLSNQNWYRSTGFKHDIHFERRSEYAASYFVRCSLCGASGMGSSGTYWELIEIVSYGWQRRCLNAHTYECACGLVFVHSQQLGAHISANRRWRKPGHGRMDKVGYGKN